MVAVEHFIDVGNILNKIWISLYESVGLLTELYVIYIERYASLAGDVRPGTLPTTIGNLPVLGELFRGRPLLFYNIWQETIKSWHAAKSTPFDPLLLIRSIPNLRTQVWPRKKHFFLFLTDLDLQKKSVI